MSENENETESVSESENPVISPPTPKVGRPHTNRDWWPHQLDLGVLRPFGPSADPLGVDFDYAAELANLDRFEIR